MKAFRKFFIHLRKKLWFPIKYVLLKRKYIRETNLRSSKEVWERLQDEKRNLLRAEVGRDPWEIKKYETIIDTINWFIL